MIELTKGIQAGCVLPTCQMYILQWPPDVSSTGGGPQVNKFDEVSSDGHQVSLTGKLGPEGWGPMSDVHGAGSGWREGGRGCYTLRFNVTWVMVMGNVYMGPIPPHG